MLKGKLLICLFMILGYYKKDNLILYWTTIQNYLNNRFNNNNSGELITEWTHSVC